MSKPYRLMTWQRGDGSWVAMWRRARAAERPGRWSQLVESYSSRRAARDAAARVAKAHTSE